MVEAQQNNQLESDRLSPEEHLLILCAGIHDDEEAADQVRRLLSRPLDWESLLRKGLDHGVASLLHSCLAEWDTRHQVPGPVSRRLNDIYYANALRAIKAERQLTDILRHLRIGGVESILLKGLFLSKAVYQNVALRPTGDIDLLIRPGDIKCADTSVRELGFAPAPGSFPLTYYRQVHFHAMYLNESQPGSIPLEIHWGVQDRFNLLRVDMDEIWSRARPWSLGDCDTLVPDPEDTLAYLCYHADKHTCFSRYVENWAQVGPEIVLHDTTSAELLWYADILRFVHLHGRTLDWSRLADRCRRWGIDGEVYSSLAVTKLLFGPSPADPVIELLGPPGTRSLQAGFYRRLMSPQRQKGDAAASIGDLARRRLLDSGFGLQFRPIRLLDISDYIFPEPERFSRAHSLVPPGLYLRYLGHVFGASLRVVSCVGLLIGCFVWKSLRRGR